MDTEFQALSWLFVDHVTIYILNKEQKTQKYEILWDQRNTRVHSDYIIENNSHINNDITLFLLKNIKSDSEIKVRFYGQSEYITRNISKKSIKTILNLLNFYKQYK